MRCKRVRTIRTLLDPVSSADTRTGSRDTPDPCAQAGIPPKLLNCKEVNQSQGVSTGYQFVRWRVGVGVGRGGGWGGQGVGKRKATEDVWLHFS